MPDSAHRSLRLPPDDAGDAPRGRNHLLAIAIDRYADPGIGHLNNAVRDLRDIAQLLQDQYNFLPENSRLLTDEAASRSGIIAAIDRLIREVQPGDNALLLFSGHGWLDQARSQGFWIPADARQGDKASYIRNQEIFDELKDIQAHHLLLIVDSCFSGAMFKDLSSPYTQAAELDKRPSRRVLTSGLDTRVSDGRAGDRNSPFAAALLRVLGEQDGSALALSQLLPRLRQHIGEQKQVPQFRPLDLPGDGLGEFVFHRRSSEIADYEAAERENSAAAWQAFLAKYPQSARRDQVHNRILTLKDEAAWQQAGRDDTETAYDRYLDAFSKGIHAQEAREKLRYLGQKSAWEIAKRRNTLFAYRDFLDVHGDSPFEADAKAALDQIRKRDEEEIKRRQQVAAEEEEKRRLEQDAEVRRKQEIQEAAEKEARLREAQQRREQAEKQERQQQKEKLNNELQEILNLEVEGKLYEAVVRLKELKPRALPEMLVEIQEHYDRIRDKHDVIEKRKREERAAEEKKAIWGSFQRDIAKREAELQRAPSQNLYAELRSKYENAMPYAPDSKASNELSDKIKRAKDQEERMRRIAIARAIKDSWERRRFLLQFLRQWPEDQEARRMLDQISIPIWQQTKVLVGVFSILLLVTTFFTVRSFFPPAESRLPVVTPQDSIAFIEDPYVGKMIRIPGGSFQMGSEEYDAEKPVHRVTLSDFYLGETEVTQAQWQAIMGSNPSEFQDCAQCPVERVSWEDVQAFIRKLNAKTGKTYRLPTEAEWEYAAGGGAAGRTKWAGTNSESSLGSYAWYSANSGSKTHPVKQKQPNALGLYDMSGNVWEWCQDWYDAYPSGAQTNPRGPADGAYRVRRGGSWYRDPVRACVSRRGYWVPDDRLHYLGFRLARSL